MKRIGIVTGGTRGIGRGISERLAAWMDILVLTYNTNAERAQQAADELRQRYSNLQRIELVAGDLTLQASRDAIFACVDRILEEQPESHLQGSYNKMGKDRDNAVCRACLTKLLFSSSCFLIAVCVHNVSSSKERKKRFTLVDV